jgi:antiviral defense system Shedu protein SduA
VMHLSLVPESAYTPLMREGNPEASEAEMVDNHRLDHLYAHPFRDGKRADGLLKTAGVLSSLCLVEIKKPNTSLLEGQAYRPDCWQASRELSGGVAQSQKTVQKTLENLPVEFRPADKNGNPTGEVLYSYRPKSFLLIGKLSEFMTNQGTNREKFASFELLRRNTIAPEIITFDELFERARFIVSRS